MPGKQTISLFCCLLSNGSLVNSMRMSHFTVSVSRASGYWFQIFYSISPEICRLRMLPDKPCWRDVTSSYAYFSVPNSAGVSAVYSGFLEVYKVSHVCSGWYQTISFSKEARSFFDCFLKLEVNVVFLQNLSLFLTPAKSTHLQQYFQCRI